jgi:hypothetical protein
LLNHKINFQNQIIAEKDIKNNEKDDMLINNCQDEFINFDEFNHLNDELIKSKTFYIFYVLNSLKRMSNELATHLTCVLNAFDMHFNAFKTLRSFTSLNEIKRKKTTSV